ncbi:MAG: DUF2336 domain-containing protein [Alphaproteobacteria bacterium]|nr:DUF2336 domain-containing protein [Alphaproteobacteria bacterium]
MTEIPPRRDKAYEKAKMIARSSDAKARRKLAAREDVQPELLYYLAEDDEPEVRRAIAENSATPPHADLILASDLHESVREGLAGKLAGLVPDIDGATFGRLHKLTRQTIATLARDELPRVRAIMSEALAELDGAIPEELRQLVKALAADEVLEVASPVLERSPLLSERDILSIITSGPPDGALAIVAKRAGLGESLADFVVEHGDENAVTQLLANESAQIREETLDRILDKAPEVEQWHDPLVRRPQLSVQVTMRIAGFVARSLLDVLLSRSDLDPETAEVVRAIVAGRIESDIPEGADEDPEEDPADEARRLHAEGALKIERLMEAISSGKRRFATAGLAAFAGMPYESARDLLATRSAKAVTALAWKAGLEMRDAIQVQLRLAGVSPQSALYARDGTDYPLSEEDLEWQLEFFTKK